MNKIIEVLDENGARVGFKADAPYWTHLRSKLTRSIQRVIPGASSADYLDLLWYLDKCEEKFAKTDDVLDACVRRYLAGKRKVSPPLTKTRKRAALRLKKSMKDLPQELVLAVDEVLSSSKWAAENEKSINSMVGRVMKKIKFNPEAVKILIIQKIKEIGNERSAANQ